MTDLHAFGTGIVDPEDAVEIAHARLLGGAAGDDRGDVDPSLEGADDQARSGEPGLSTLSVEALAVRIRREEADVRIIERLGHPPDGGVGELRRRQLCARDRGGGGELRDEDPSRLGLRQARRDRVERRGDAGRAECLA